MHPQTNGRNSRILYEKWEKPSLRKAINTIPAWSEQNLQNDGSTPPAAKMTSYCDWIKRNLFDDHRPCIISSIPFSRLRTHSTNLSLQICPRLVKGDANCLDASERNCSSCA
ncbi:hypothetical protein T4B_8047 [Trichinella pseudospiralis]|uniref:Uncharacterized protein n=2 Tax=Trichinella pseudospiralis TaxID=6337 RepID=A0A0V1FJ57_TRIPS|nr:hypothetical protein T4D_8852 [Trichinella pseudospiralis]KRZ30377.1 hypothetical protein T4B_8047 [Trichinella pseudospiralis]